MGWDYRKATKSEELDEGPQVRGSVRLSHSRHSQVRLIPAGSWDNTARLLDVLQANIPQGVSLVVTQKHQWTTAFVTPKIPERISDPLPAYEEIRAPIPDMFGAMHLQRVSRVFRLETGRNTYYRKPRRRSTSDKLRPLYHPFFPYEFDNYPVNHRISQIEAFTYTREGETVPKLEAEALSAFWPAERFPVGDVDAGWELPASHVQLLEEFQGRSFGFEEQPREEILVSDQVYHVGKKEVIMERKNVNEDEGFA